MRASKYGAYDSAGVFGLVPVRETAPRLLTFAMKPFGRRQLESVRVAAAMSGKEAAMRWARVWGAELDTQIQCLFLFFFFLFYHAFIVSRYKKLRAALAMERTKPINQNK